MRSLCLLCLFCLGSALLAHPAHDLPEPGRNDAFLARVLERPEEGQGRPWHTFRVPPEGASAVVEVVGELTAEEFRQVRFNEFLAWFQADLRTFWRRHGGGEVTNPLPTARTGGPGPQLVALGRANF
jgi:hypothetical protein